LLLLLLSCLALDSLLIPAFATTLTLTLLGSLIPLIAITSTILALLCVVVMRLLRQIEIGTPSAGRWRGMGFLSLLRSLLLLLGNIRILTSIRILIRVAAWLLVLRRRRRLVGVVTALSCALHILVVAAIVAIVVAWLFLAIRLLTRLRSRRLIQARRRRWHIVACRTLLARSLLLLLWSVRAIALCTPSLTGRRFAVRIAVAKITLIPCLLRASSTCLLCVLRVALRLSVVAWRLRARGLWYRGSTGRGRRND
jgi:hypothetical protein